MSSNSGRLEDCLIRHHCQPPSASFRRPSDSARRMGLSLRMAMGTYPLGIIGTFSSPLLRIHPVPVSVNCFGYRFLPIPVLVRHRSGNRYPTGTAYPINKDTWGRSFVIGDISSSPGYKCRSLGDAEEKERGCEEDEQRW